MGLDSRIFGEALMYEFDWDAISSVLPILGKGMMLTLKLTGVAVLAGITGGVLLALLRLSAIPVLSWPVIMYINFFRSVPLVMVLLGFFLLAPAWARHIFGLPDNVEMRLPLAMVGFSLFEAAYYAEIIRAGIQGIRKTQVQAAYALGLDYAQTMRWVVLPQALRNMLPVLLTQAIILFQDTSLVYVGGLLDFFGTVYTAANNRHAYVELFIFSGLIYFLLCFAASYGVGCLQTRFVNTGNSLQQ
jgi:glutamate/aspartate transport system permease protein